MVYCETDNLGGYRFECLFDGWPQCLTVLYLRQRSTPHCVLSSVHVRLFTLLMNRLHEAFYLATSPICVCISYDWIKNVSLMPNLVQKILPNSSLWQTFEKLEKQFIMSRKYDVNPLWYLPNLTSHCTDTLFPSYWHDHQVEQSYNKMIPSFNIENRNRSSTASLWNIFCHRLCSLPSLFLMLCRNRGNLEKASAHDGSFECQFSVCCLTLSVDNQNWKVLDKKK